MSDCPAGLFGRQRCPVSFDDPGVQFQGAHAAPPTGVTIQAALDSNGTHGTVIGCVGGPAFVSQRNT
jgi:hypothetical protein